MAWALHSSLKVKMHMQGVTGKVIGLGLISVLFSLSFGKIEASCLGAVAALLHAESAESYIITLASELKLPVFSIDRSRLIDRVSGNFNHYDRIPLDADLSVGMRRPYKLYEIGPARLKQDGSFDSEAVDYFREEVLNFQRMQKFGGPYLFGMIVEQQSKESGLAVEDINHGHVTVEQQLKSYQPTPRDLRAFDRLASAALQNGYLPLDLHLSNLIWIAEGQIRPIDISLLTWEEALHRDTTVFSQAHRTIDARKKLLEAVKHNHRIPADLQTVPAYINRLYDFLEKDVIAEGSD